ncbi:MAG: hypothetical protein DI535_06710 [Citrobacter freundii]|nr:MAG: hypothetical protein DI535_06710 [Citrobacter freundii]
MKRILLFAVIYIFCGTLICYPQKKIPSSPGPAKSPGTMYIDRKDIKTKEITAELPFNTDGTIFLENILRVIDIKTGTDGKIKLSTTISYYGTPAYTDQQWLEELDISMNGQPKSVVIKTGKQFSREGKTEAATIPEEDSLIDKKAGELSDRVAIIGNDGKWVNRKAAVFRKIILYVPAQALLDITSKYGKITISNDLNEVVAKITSGSLKMKNVKYINLSSSYSRIETENIQQSKISLSNAKFIVKKNDRIEINSSNSIVNAADIKTMTINSTNDRYEIQELGSATGEKKYGNFEITSLKDSLNITGVNADIKLRSIFSSVRTIRINNKYGEMHLPIRLLKNWTLDVTGANTSISAPFKLKANADKTQTAEAGAQINSTKFQLKCNDCNIDFN